jgi:hypothetical protein
MRFYHRRPRTFLDYFLLLLLGVFVVFAVRLLLAKLYVQHVTNVGQDMREQITARAPSQRGIASRDYAGRDAAALWRLGVLRAEGELLDPLASVGF